MMTKQQFLDALISSLPNVTCLDDLVHKAFSVAASARPLTAMNTTKQKAHPDWDFYRVDIACRYLTSLAMNICKQNNCNLTDVQDALIEYFCDVAPEEGISKQYAQFAITATSNHMIDTTNFDGATDQINRAALMDRTNTK